MAPGHIGAGTELADQHDLVASGVVEQGGGRLAALEDFAADDVARAAVVKAVAEEIAHDLEVPLERSLLANQFRSFLGIGHLPDPSEKTTARPRGTRRREDGSEGRDRTCDPAINSRLLYR